MECTTAGSVGYPHKMYALGVSILVLTRWSLAVVDDSEMREGSSIVLRSNQWSEVVEDCWLCLFDCRGNIWT